MITSSYRIVSYRIVSYRIVSRLSMRAARMISRHNKLKICSEVIFCLIFNLLGHEKIFFILIDNITYDESLCSKPSK